MALKQFLEFRRKRLERDLDKIMYTPLTIVIAPMGYGKTTAINSFLNRHRDGDQLVLTMGQDEVEEEWFWQELLIRIRSSLAVEDRVIWEAGIPRNRIELDRFLKSIRNMLKKPCYVILDDFHNCRGAALNELIVRLAHEDLQYLHIVLLSQTYPELQYDELRLNGACVIISQQDMILDAKEIDEIFIQNGIKLSQRELEFVVSYTSGWISAVLLLLLDYQNRNVLQGSVSIFHLMKSAIYQKLPVIVQKALVKMSLFDNFTLDEMNYVAECKISEYSMRSLEEMIGFIQFDHHAHTYHLHTLLRSVAREELEKDSVDKRRLYLRAAEWNEREKNLTSAVRYYRKAVDAGSIFRLLEASNSFQMDQVPELIHDFFREIREEEALNHPNAYLRYIYFLLLRGEEEEGFHRFDRAKEWFTKMAEEDESYCEVLGEVYLLESIVHFNHLEEINACMAKCKELRNGKPSEIFVNLIMTYGTPNTLQLYHWKPGALRWAVEQEKLYTEAYSWLVNRMDGNWNDMVEAEYQYARGCFEEARRLARQACVKAELRSQICVGISSFAVLLYSDIALGDKCSFEADMVKLQELMAGISRQILLQDYEQVIGYVYGLIGVLEQIPEWLRDFKVEECNYMVRSIHSGSMVCGIYLRQKKFWDRLETIADRMMVPYGRTEHVSVELYSCCFKAIAVAGRQNAESGVPYLQKALEIAGMDGIVVPFIENAEELMPVLRCLPQKDAFVAEIIEKCQLYIRNLDAFGKRKNVQLTPRERELMELVREGKRNYEIGQRLNIAAVTVEKTLTSVYRKLNVSNRVSAVKQMEELYGNAK